MIDNNSLLDDVIQREEMRLIRATSGQRITNYVIDMIINTVITMFVFGMLLIVFLGEDAASELNPVVDHIISAIATAIIYFITEISLHGKTLGKYVTKTRVVTTTGDTPTANQYLGRSFARAVPFDAFSFLNDNASGWHDKWSDTMVIDEKLSVWN